MVLEASFYFLHAVVFLVLVTLTRDTSAKQQSIFPNTNNKYVESSRENENKMEEFGLRKYPVKPLKTKNRKHSSTQQKVPILPTVKVPLSIKFTKGFEKLKKTIIAKGEDVLMTTKLLQRELKAYFSSDFETLLLSLTRPDEKCPQEIELDKVVQTIESFHFKTTYIDDENPYRITLHKIWCKTEEDERSCLKAWFILHTILRCVSPPQGKMLKKWMVKLSKEICPKTDSRYFDTKKLIKRQIGLVGRYGVYCIQRGRQFTSSFIELELIGKEKRPSIVCSLLLKALQLIDTALSCTAEPGEEGDLSIMCLDLLARDLQELFLLYAEKLQWLLEEQEASGGNFFEGWTVEEVEAVTSRFKQFYNDKVEEVRSFLRDVSQSLELYGAELPIDMDELPKHIN